MLRLGLQTTLSHRTVPHLPASVHAAAVLGRRSLGLVTTTPLPHLRRLGGSLRPHQAFNPPARVIVPATLVVGTRAFHNTRRNNALPMLPFLAGVLKASTALEIVRTAARVVLTFVPVVLIKNAAIKKKLKWAQQQGDTATVEKIERHMKLKASRERVWIFHFILFIPVFIFWATILASMERTPLTGRWRLILLSPEEEEEISAQLAGPGWYQAISDILAADGTSPRILPLSDWRLTWVQDTLRRLESVIPLLQYERELDAKWLECGPNDIPLPPPADYPLNPRPRASEFVRRFAELSCGRAPPPIPHGIPGPPYSLVVVDKPDASNAFSYGFGPDGGGGIVVFSGFLDDILSKHCENLGSPATTPERSWWSYLFGSLTPTAPPPHQIPTAEQTSELAILLAHELSHLILSHHLETLSSGSIIWPGILSITTDVIRTVLFPVTMLFGPFVNDALAGIGKAGSGEVSKLTEYCTSQKQEIEADVVSARLLAHAGFDPRHAVRFWEERQETERTAECTPARAQRIATAEEGWEMQSLPMQWRGSSHPMNVIRVQRLKGELERWQKQREETRRRLQEQAAMQE